MNDETKTPTTNCCAPDCCDAETRAKVAAETGCCDPNRDGACCDVETCREVAEKTGCCDPATVAATTGCC